MIRGRELLVTIAETTRERLGAAACSIALLDGSELEFVAAAGAGAAEIVGVRIPIARGIAGWVVASGQAIAVGDVNSDRRFDRRTAESTGYIPATILAVAIEGEDGPLGVLEVLDREPSAQDMTIAGAAARQAMLVLSLDSARSEVDDLLADPALTELLGLLHTIGRLGPAQRNLAAALLTAVIENSP